MTPLAVAVLNYLKAEAGWPPLKSEGISRGLFCTGTGLTVDPIPATAIEGALSELMAAGQVEAVHSARLGARFRIMKSMQADNVPESAVSDARE